MHKVAEIRDNSPWFSIDAEFEDQIKYENFLTHFTQKPRGKECREETGNSSGGEVEEGIPQNGALCLGMDGPGCGTGQQPPHPW